MIPYQSVLDYIKAEPFRPFRIHMASGRTFDIRHPELLKVSKHYLVIFTPMNDSPDLIDSFHTASLTLTEAISHIEAAVA